MSVNTRQLIITTPLSFTDVIVTSDETVKENIKSYPSMQGASAKQTDRFDTSLVSGKGV